MWFSPSRWRRAWVSEAEGQRVHWEWAGRGALGETTHDPRAGVGGVRHNGCRARWRTASNHLASSGLVSSSRFCPDPSWGPQTECGRNITSRHGCWQVQVTGLSAISHMDFLCSHQIALDFESISRPCLHLIPWFLTPDWVIMEALLWWTQAHPTAPAGVGLRLYYGSSSSSPTQ